MSLLVSYIAQGEHQEQDFKFSIEDQKKIARTLAAFANTDGGRLLIGVKDNGRIAGCNPEEEFHMVQGAAQVYVQPSLAVTSVVHQEGHKLVLEVQVPKGLKKIYQARDEEDQWKLYMRLNDHTLVVNKILQKVWRFETLPKSQPETFEEKALNVLKSIDENGITLSKLYRTSGVEMKIVDHWLPLFISWDLVGYKFEDPSIYYFLRPIEK